MISSTSLDLPEHRKQVIEACQRMDFFPEAMEHLPARDVDAIRVSLEMVDKADIYLGIFAWRYGHIPEGYEVSITELEFERAVKRGIRILVFLMRDNFPLPPKLVEKTEIAQKKLEALKNRASQGWVWREFGSPEELHAEALCALGDLKQREQQGAGESLGPSLHRPGDIPPAPARYVAHPYTLLQTAEVIGRREELKLLTDWVTRNEQVPKNTRLFCVVAIGGMGKSALTWKWFEDIAPNELPHLAGRMWWSFYESDAHYENFLLRALAYAADMSEAEARQVTAREREDRLLRLLDERPFLVVLDGLERILVAYARLDAAHLADDDLDEQTANELAGAIGLAEEVRETYFEKYRLRRCADPRAGEFLKKLTRVRASRVLVSTRLYPAELQTEAAQPLPGCYPHFLRGLTDDDALALWRGFIGGERSGTSAQLLPLFRAFGHYPLLLRALAGEVAVYRPAPGDFERWHQDHPQFNPAGLPLKNARTHVLHFALRGLDAMPRRVLYTLATFRMLTTWDTLRALLVGQGKPCPNERALDAVLTELEDRGLVGWDKPANRYDLHPIVRTVVWAMLNPTVKQDLHGTLLRYFEAVPKVDAANVKVLDDLAPVIELYCSLVGLQRFEDAANMFIERLFEPMLNNLSLSRTAAELLEPLLGEDLDIFSVDLDLTKPSLYLTKPHLLKAVVGLSFFCQMMGSPRIAVRLCRRILSMPSEIQRNRQQRRSLRSEYQRLRSLNQRLRSLLPEDQLLRLPPLPENEQTEDEDLPESKLHELAETAALWFAPAFLTSGDLRELEGMLLHGLKFVYNEANGNQIRILSFLSLVHAARGSAQIAETIACRIMRLSITVVDGRWARQRLSSP
jgi:hypothetical protein